MRGTIRLVLRPSSRLFATCTTLACASVAACGGLDPIVSPDGGPDATVDVGVPSDASRDASPADAPADTSPALDAGSDADAASDAPETGAPFTCGSKVCDSVTHYCERAGLDGGAPPDAAPKPDAGEVDTCIPYPTNCTDDGGKPSCACITGPCTCSENGTEITVTCP
jgi:hypothetical protein